MDASAKMAIERRLAEFERSSSTQIVVAIIPSLEGSSIEDLAVKIVEKWGIGQKGKNNGVLLLVAMADRKARIEVGYGLEDRLTDALSRGILEDRLFPQFRSGNYGAGILSTCDAIIDATQGAYTAVHKKGGGKLVPLVPIAIIVLFILIGLQRGGGITGGGRRRYFRSGPIWWGGGGFGGGGGWSGGGFGGGGGGGGFSGGGGLSGGGGASGSW